MLLAAAGVRHLAETTGIARGSSVSSLIIIIDTLSSLLPARYARSVRWRIYRWAKSAAAAGFDTEAMGLRWHLHPVDNVTERLIWLHRDHPERKSLDWARGLVQGKRALILDIGANCGAFAIPLAAAAGAGSRCLAFEPNPVMIARLQTNLRLNDLSDRVEICPFALGAASGEATLSYTGNLGEASLRASSGQTGQQTRHQVTVPLRRLSDCLADVTDSGTIFLKIDVESYEPEVLLPFFATAARAIWPHYILIEIEHRSDWSSDLGGALERLGYDTVDTCEGNSFLRLRVA